MIAIPADSSPWIRPTTSALRGLAFDLPGAAAAGAALFGAFTLALVAAIARGKGGSPCGCFGTRSRIGWPAVARSALLSAAFVVVPFVPDAHLSTDAWLAVGL